MRALLAGLLVVGACDATEPDLSTPPPPSVQLGCRQETVGTWLWVRFWDAGGRELACEDVVAAGYVLEAGPLGGEAERTARVSWCARELEPDAAARAASGLFHLDVPRFATWGLRAVDADGVPRSVEAVVGHTWVECAVGVTERHLSVVLD
jgi:hypothetical protein